MNNIPQVKIGVVAVSRDCFPESLSVNRRKALMKAYTEKFGATEIYECPVCIVESEIHMVQALEDVKNAGCNALVVYLGNFGPEISETLLAKHFDGPVMFVAAAEESADDLMDGRGDAYCGMLNASYNLKLRGVKAYIPEYPVGTAEECADMIHEFVPIARTIVGLKSLKIISFGPRPLNFLACNAPIKPLYELGVEIEENSELDLFEAFNKHADDPRIPKVVADMEKELGKGNMKPEILPKLAQYEITLLDWVEEQVRIARSMTDKPIGANVMLMDPNAAQTAELLAKLRVDVITTGAGSPANYMQLWKDAGIKVVPVVASSALAARMERLGADAVVAEGTEAGGHIGELTTMALIPAVCDAVSIPVIAAGGIADGRGMAAAFALGAEGVQAGTRFLTVDECTISDAYKERVIAAKDADTIVTGRGSGHPVRCLKNKFARTVRKLEGDVAANGDELEAMYVGSLRRAVEGDVDNGTMMAGQSAALVHERATAAEAIARMIEEAEALGGLDLEALAALSARRGRAI